MNNIATPECGNTFGAKVRIGFPETDTPPELKALHEAQRALFKNLVREVFECLAPPTVETIVPFADAARMLHVKPITLRRMIYGGRIGYVQDGKNYFFKVSDLNAYINSHYTPAGHGPAPEQSAAPRADE